LPELPEVQTIKNQLNQYLPKKIKKITTSPQLKSILHTKIPEGLIEQSITKIFSHGKLLQINFSNDLDIVALSHLGMTGSWIYSNETLEEKHNHFQFYFSDGSTLNYVDPRRFGHLYFYNRKQVADYMTRLGPDISSPSFTFARFESSLKKYPSRLIKPHLLEQKFFAGSGNYIANEVCAFAGVRPDREIGTLKVSEIKKLFESFKIVLDRSLKSGGVTFQGGYRDANGQRGEGVSGLVVFHQKVCQLCCNSEVKKIVLVTRGTFYCPNCQK
jgi:formamidopyrimidine-DNA glycosylase